MDKVVEVRIRKACLALLRRANRQVGSPPVAGKMRANFYKAVEVHIRKVPCLWRERSGQTL